MARFTCFVAIAVWALSACGDASPSGAEPPRDVADLLAGDSTPPAPDATAHDTGLGDGPAPQDTAAGDTAAPFDGLPPSDTLPPPDSAPADVAANDGAPPPDAAPPSDTPGGDAGDVGAPTFAIERFEVHQVNPGEPWVGYTATEAEQCTLRLTSGSRTLERAGLPAGSDAQTVRLNFGSEPGVDRVDLELTCTGPTGWGRATAQLDDHIPVELVNRWTTPACAPAEGGAVDFCWEVQNAERCELFFPEGNVPAAATGCYTLVVPAGGGIDGILNCTGGESALSDAFGSWSGQCVELHADRRFLAAPGDVTLTWTAVAAGDCVLQDGAGTELSRAAAGAATVAVAADETFLLTCTSADGQPLSYTLNVQVGARVEAFQTMGIPPELDRIPLYWKASGYERCTLAVENANIQLLLDNLAPFVASSPTFAELGQFFSVHGPLAGAGETTLTFSCTGPSGPSAPTTLVIAEPGPVRLDRFEVIPDALPPGGGPVDVCWEVAHATGCYLYVLDPTRPDSQLNFSGRGTACLSDPGLNGAELPITVPSEARLECFGAFDGLYAVRSIAVGPTIRAFAADTDALQTPGTVTMSWDTVGMAACELRDASGPRASGLTSAGTPVAIVATTDFTLACVGLEGTPLERTLRVGVGPAVLLLTGYAVDPFAAAVSVKTTPFVDDCQLFFDRADGWRYSQFDVVVGGFYPEAATATWYWDFDVFGPLTATVFCHAGGTVLRQTIGVPGPAALPPHLVSLSATPPVQPTAPTSFQVCWEFSGAEQCRAMTLMGQTFPDVPAMACQDVTVDGNDEFYVFCGNAVGERQGLIRLPVGPNVLTFAADPPQLFLDEGSPASTLSWETFDMVTCTLETPSGSAVVPVNGSQVEIFPNVGLAQNILACSDSSGATLIYGLNVFTWEMR